MGRTFSYDYRSSDYSALTSAARIAYPRNVHATARMLGWAAILTGLAAGVTFGLSFGFTSPLPAQRVVSAIVWGVAGAMIISTLTTGALNSWLLSRAHGAKSLEGETIAIAFSDAGFSRRSLHMETQANWHAVDCIVEKNGSVYIATGYGVSFIPQRAFANADARTDLVVWVIGQLDPIARERSEALRGRTS